MKPLQRHSARMLFSSKHGAYVCARCLRSQRRHFVDAASLATLANPPVPPRAAAAKLDNRSLISVRGADTPKFLQGLVTNNVSPSSNAGFYAAFLTPAGRVINDVFVYPTRGSLWHGQQTRANGDEQEPGFLIELDSAQAGGLVKLMKRHRLRSKFEIRLLDEGEIDVWNVWRDAEDWTGFDTTGSFIGDAGVLGLTDRRAPGMGDRLLLSPQQKEASLDEVEHVPHATYRVRRYLKGVAEGLDEIPEGSLPMNSNLDVMGGIDFKKGCYAGQELTIRTHHTGVVRRRILPVLLYPSSQHGSPPTEFFYDPSVSYDLDQRAEFRREESSKRAAGKFVGLVGNIGLATCPIEHMPESNSGVDSDSACSIPTDQYVVRGNTGDQVYGVQVFVPAWMRARIRSPKVQKRVE